MNKKKKNNIKKYKNTNLKKKYIKRFKKNAKKKRL